MPLQISAFKGYLSKSPAGGALQVIDSPPVAVSAATFAGAYVVPPFCTVIRINGTGTIAWPDVAEPEAFAGVEFRGVRPGQQFTVA